MPKSRKPQPSEREITTDIYDIKRPSPKGESLFCCVRKLMGFGRHMLERRLAVFDFANLAILLLHGLREHILDLAIDRAEFFLGPLVDFFPEFRR